MHRVSTVLGGSTRRGPRRASATTPGCWPPHLLTAALRGRRPLRPINLRRVRTLTTELELNAGDRSGARRPRRCGGGGRCGSPGQVAKAGGAPDRPARIAQERRTSPAAGELAGRQSGQRRALERGASSRGNAGARLAEETQDSHGQPAGREHRADHPADEPGLEAPQSRYARRQKAHASDAGDVGRTARLVDEDAVGGMPAETPADRGRRLVDALIVWIMPDHQLEPGEVRVSEARRHVARTAAGVKMDTTLAPTCPAAAGLERPASTARRLAEASISPDTRRAYSGALRRLDAWLDGRPLKDPTLASYLAELHDQGRAPASNLDGGWRRRASGSALLASRARPGNGRPGSSSWSARPAGCTAGTARTGPGA